MSQEIQETNSVSPANLPVKRKRGRPRKDERLVHGEKASVTPGSDGMKASVTHGSNVMKASVTPGSDGMKASVTPGSDGMKRNRRRKVDPGDGTNNAMVGQVVSGVLEGSFDAGYLLTVRVGNTDTILSGVVFEPGLSIPISVENDVAPHVKMIKRNEIPLPVVDPQIPMHGSRPRSKQKTEQHVNLLQKNEGALQSKVSPTVNQVPRIANQVSPSKHLTGSPVALKGMPNNSNHVPQHAPPALAEVKSVSSPCPPFKKPSGDINQVAQVSSQTGESQPENRKSPDKLPRYETVISGKEVNTNQPPLVMPQQTVSELKNQFGTVTEPLEHNRIVKLTEVLQENEASPVIKGPPNGVDAPQDLKVESKSDPSFKILQANEPINQVPEVQHQDMGSELKPDELVNDALMGAYLELDCTPRAAVPEYVATELTSETIKTLQENQASPMCDMPRGLQAELSVEVPRRDETTQSNKMPLSDSYEMTEGGDSQSAPKIYQPVEMFQRDDIPSAPYDSEAKRMAKQSFLPVEVPEIPNLEFR